MKLSIVIPVYNGENFIIQNFNNILEQNINDFEIIYVDNNSEDTSILIIQNLQKKYSFVRLSKEIKQGPGSARNKGLKVAKGEYICFLDIDDLYYKGILSRYIKILDNNPSVCSVFGKHSRNSFIKNLDPYPTVNILIPPQQGIKWFEYFSELTGPPCFMHRTNIVKELGGFPEVSFGEDAAFHINLGLRYKIAYLDTYSYCYFRHLNSDTSKSNKIQSLASKYFKQYIEYYIPQVYRENNFLELKSILIKKVFSTIGKLLLEENSTKERMMKYKELKQKILPIKVPFSLEVIYKSICYTNIEFIQRTILTRAINYLYR